MQNVALINTWQMQLYSLTPWFLHPFTVATWHPPKSHNGINRSERVNPPNCRIFGGVSSLTKTSRNTLRRLWAIVDRSPARRVQSQVVPEGTRSGHRSADVSIHARVLAVQAQPRLVALPRHLSVTSRRSISTFGRKMWRHSCISVSASAGDHVLVAWESGWRLNSAAPVIKSCCIHCDKPLWVYFIASTKRGWRCDVTVQMARSNLTDSTLW